MSFHRLVLFHCFCINIWFCFLILAFGEPNTLDDEKYKNEQHDREGKVAKNDETTEPKKKESILKKSGGAHIPPATLKMLQEQITDKSSSEYQRLSWEALTKSISGLINKVNTLGDIVRELFQT